MQILCCRKRTLRTRPRTGVCKPLMPDVVASKAQSQLCDLSRPTFGFTTQEFSMVGGYTDNHKTFKIGGWALAQVWALAQDNTVFSQQKSELVDTCTLFRLISEVPSHWRELESPGERAIETLSSLVTKFADDVAVSIRYVVTVIRI